MQAKLAGITVLLTRQAEHNQILQQQIAALGGNSISLPLFAIAPQIDANGLTEIHNKLTKCALAVCISQNAALILAPILAAHDTVRWATVGKTTAAFLAQYGIREILYPKTPPYDSAGLLHVLHTVNLNLQNQYIMVFTGVDGDGWLKTALSQCGAKVEIMPLYARIMPAITRQQICNIFGSRPRVDIVLITCITSLVNLMKLAAAENIEIGHVPLLVVSQRIYNYAMAAGFMNVSVARSISTVDILEALVNIGEKNAKISQSAN